MLTHKLSVLFLGFFLATSHAETCSFGIALEGLPPAKNQIEEVISSQGCTPNSITLFLQWQERFTKAKELQATIDLASEYQTKFILTWEPMQWQTNSMQAIPYEKILSGAYNSYIDEVSAVLKESPTPIIVRLAHEMNLQQYAWGAQKENYDAKSPERFQKLYRYTVQRVRKIVSKETVLFAFNPNNDSVPATPWNTIARYYPGDAYVDILGIDGYNWGETVKTASWVSQWQTPAELFDRSLVELRNLAPHKPVYIFETASVGTQEQKQVWLQQLLTYGAEKKIVSSTWFHVNKEQDWRLPTQSR